MDAETPRINWSSDNLESKWTKFENHAKLMFIGPLAGKTAKQRCAYLLIWAGEQGREIFSTFDLTDDGMSFVVCLWTLSSALIFIYNGEMLGAFQIPGLDVQ